MLVEGKNTPMTVLSEPISINAHERTVSIQTGKVPRMGALNMSIANGIPARVIAKVPAITPANALIVSQKYAAIPAQIAHKVSFQLHVHFPRAKVAIVHNTAPIVHPNGKSQLSSVGAATYDVHVNRESKTAHINQLAGLVGGILLTKTDHESQSKFKTAMAAPIYEK